MGGKKKLNLKQMERMQDKKKPLGILPPDVKADKVAGELKKMSVLTPYAVATRYGIRISAAKDFLEQLEKQGAVHLVSGSHNIKIYKAA
jgi:ribosomal protein S25